MMKAAAIAALSIPVFCAAADYTADMQTTAAQADTCCASFSQVSDELKALGVELPAPSPEYTPAGTTAPDETTVTSELGMMFDAANSRIIYLGNVQLVDSRINIAAREQLHIYLPELKTDKKDKGNETPATEQTEQAASTTTETGEDTPVSRNEGEAPVIAAAIAADYALADTLSNTILVYSPSEDGEIHLQYGDNKVHITAAEGSKAPRLLADQQGNILLEGAEIRLSMKDNDGAATELCTRGGSIYYHSPSNTLYAPGNSTLNHPQGTLTCNEMLCIVLQTAASPAPEKKKGFMSQFTGLKFEGIATATARGQVIATRNAGEATPAAEAHGDELRYNGQSGECSLTGTACKLVYDQYTVESNEGIHLLPNGDIELRGDNINGRYARQSSTPGTTLTGVFKAAANVLFRADLGTVSTAKGIVMADDEADFSCTGPVNLVLARKEGAKTPETKPGMPNLAITQYGDISRARAEGNVIAHRYEAGTRKCIGELQAQIAETDLTTGETLLTGAPDTELVAHYNGNRLAATPAAGQSATVELRSNGDIRLNGAQLSAVLLDEEGTTKAECRDYVLLVRAENRLETGSATRLQTDKAILTTNGPLHTYLVADESATAKGKFTGLRFNYTGIREASTESGCTVRTEKGSMQCTGPVRLLMNEQKGKDKMLGGLVRATASGNVAVAGKDNSGKLFRATGDFLNVDNTNGMKVLSGSKVTLADANNTHVASGKGAAIRIDASNNASITGEKHTTHATNIKQQINNPTFKK